MTRKQFMESLGATCNNWQNSWSFINREEKVIYFGAWRSEIDDIGQVIFSSSWLRGPSGRIRNGYNQSRDHIRLIENEGYMLKTFPMELDPVNNRIKKLEPVLTTHELKRIGDNWYAD